MTTATNPPPAATPTAYALAKPLRDAFPQFAAAIDSLCAGIVKSTTPDMIVLQGNAVFFPYSPFLKRYDFADGATQVGYSAAHIYSQWGDYDVTVTSEADNSVQHVYVSITADKRKEIQVADGADLKAIAEALTEPTTLLLHAGATFHVTEAINVNMPDVHFAAAGPGPMPRIVRSGTPSSTIVALKPRCRVTSIEFDTDRTFATWGPEKVNYNAFVPRAPGCAFVGNVVRNMDCGVQCWPSIGTAGGVLVQSNRFTRELRANAVYAMGGNVCIYGNVMEDSQCEDLIRVSDPNLMGLNIIGNTLYNDSSSKASWSLREIGEGAYIANNEQFTYGRLGEFKPGTNATSVRRIVVRLNRWYERLDANVNGSFILIDGAADLTITQNQWFNWSGKNVAVMTDGPCQNIQIKGNTRTPWQGMLDPRWQTQPFVSHTKIVDLAGVIESDNTTLPVAAAPMAIPPKMPVVPAVKTPAAATSTSAASPAAQGQHG